MNGDMLDSKPTERIEGRIYIIASRQLEGGVGVAPGGGGGGVDSASVITRISASIRSLARTTFDWR
jgi:hypothetical protein